MAPFVEKESSSDSIGRLVIIFLGDARLLMSMEVSESKLLLHPPHIICCMSGRTLKVYISRSTEIVLTKLLFVVSRISILSTTPTKAISLSVDSVT